MPPLPTTKKAERSVPPTKKSKPQTEASTVPERLKRDAPTTLQISHETKLRDIDELDLIEAILEIESELNITIPDDLWIPMEVGSSTVSQLAIEIASRATSVTAEHVISILTTMLHKSATRRATAPVITPSASSPVTPATAEQVKPNSTDELIARAAEIFSRIQPNVAGVTMINETIDRARDALNNVDAVADVNTRLGTQVSEIPAVLTYSYRIDVDRKNGKQFPVMFLDETVLNYLRIHPSNQSLLISIVLGIWVDPVGGPVPTLFIRTSIANQQRMVAAVWATVKYQTALLSEQLKAFGHLERQRIGDLQHVRGLEGGVQEVSNFGIYIQGKTGLDLQVTSHWVPFKLWNALQESVLFNVTAKSLWETAKPWPYPSQLEGGIDKTPGGSADFKGWY